MSLKVVKAHFCTQIMRYCGKEILPYFKFIFQIISIDIDKYILQQYGFLLYQSC